MVHPAQHALSFLLTNNNEQDPMYFANDGGVYRTLNGYSGLTDGACGGGTNQFDSLNQTLGSMTSSSLFPSHPKIPIRFWWKQGNGVGCDAIGAGQYQLERTLSQAMTAVTTRSARTTPISGSSPARRMLLPG